MENKDNRIVHKTMSDIIHILIENKVKPNEIPKIISMLQSIYDEYPAWKDSQKTDKEEKVLKRIKGTLSKILEIKDGKN